MKVQFRCPPELESILPRPILAKRGLPDWLKRMPTTVKADELGLELETVKQCPPFVNAMTSGFLMPLVADITVDRGKFTWNWDPPPAQAGSYTRAPLAFHPNHQLVETPFFDDDRQAIKFANFWTVELPPGYAMLATHPVNRADLPFRSLTGLIDAVNWKSLVHFPAMWIDDDFVGVLPKGTPVVQCFPVAYETLDLEFSAFESDDAAALVDAEGAVRDTQGAYRKLYRAKPSDGGSSNRDRKSDGR
jgi:hypothetical protein